MIWLSNSTLARLRDQLQARGRRPSVVPQPGKSEEAVELDQVVAEYGPLCDAMYLMMSADGTVSTEERDLLRGALRNLSTDSIRSAHMEAMLERAEKRIGSDGRDTTMKSVVNALNNDPARAEVAFVLAAAMAFADSAIADEENETLNTFADSLGIDEARANELLDAVEADLRNQAAEGG